MAGFVPGTKRQRGESAFARRLLSVVGIDSLLRNDHDHLSRLSEKFQSPNTTIDSSWDHSFEKLTRRSTSRTRRNKQQQQQHSTTLQKDDVFVPQIQRRPMRFFPTTTPAFIKQKGEHQFIHATRKRNTSISSKNALRNAEANDTLDLVHLPQHEQESITALYKNNDAQSDITGAPTEIINNRNKIRDGIFRDLIHQQQRTSLPYDPSESHNTLEQIAPTPTRIPVAIFRPRFDKGAFLQQSPWQRKELPIHLWSSSSSSLSSLRNKLSTETPDPVFCSYPESPSTRGGSFGSDYVSTAAFRDERNKEDESSAGDNSVLTLNRNSSQDAIVLNSLDKKNGARELTGERVLVPVVANGTRAGWRWPPRLADDDCDEEIPTKENSNESSFDGRSQSLVMDSRLMHSNNNFQATQRKAAVRKWNVDCGSGIQSTTTNTLSSFLNKDSQKISVGVKSVRAKFENWTKATHHEIDSDDGGSVRSLRELFEKGTDAQEEEDDDDDSGSVRSLKEKFEKHRSHGLVEVKSDVKKLAAMFESKQKTRVNKRFECENAAVKKAYSKFEELHAKSKRATARSSEKTMKTCAEQPVEKNTDFVGCRPKPETNDPEIEDAGPPRVSVADRIRAFSIANSGNAVTSRFPVKRFATANPNSIEQHRIARREHNNTTIHARLDRKSPVTDDSSDLNILADVQSREHALSITKDIVGKTSSPHTQGPLATSFPVQQSLSQSRSLCANTGAGHSYSQTLGCCTGPLISEDSLDFATSPLRANYTVLTSQRERSKASLSLPIFENDEINETESSGGSRFARNPAKETPTAESEAKPTIQVTPGPDKRTFVDPVKYTKSLSSDPLLMVRRMVKNKSSSLQLNTVKQKRENSNREWDNLSDAVTVDVSIAEVSNLAVSSVVASSVERNVNAVDRSGTSTAEKPAATIDQSSETCPPVRNNEDRVNQISKDSNSGIVLARHVTSTSYSFGTTNEKKESQNHFEANATLPTITHRTSPQVDDLYPTSEDSKEDIIWDSGWDPEQIAASFPDANTSGTDIFEFESEWKSSPSRETSNLDCGRSFINETVVKQSPTRMLQESKYDFLSTPKIQKEPGRVSRIERLLDNGKEHQGCLSQTMIAEVQPKTAQYSSDQKKHLPVWKRRSGGSSPATQSTRTIPLPDRTKPAQWSGLPPRDEATLSSDKYVSDKYVNLMSRLAKLKQTRRMRAASAYPPVAPLPRSATINSCVDLEDVSSSSFSSTHFGGNAFMEALEVD